MASFLSLPREIRIQIYRELFHCTDLGNLKQNITKEVDGNLLFHDKNCSSNPPLLYAPSQQHKTMSPILRTSGTIYREALKVFYEESSFRFQSQAHLASGLPTVSSIGFPNETFHWIQHVELVINLRHNRPCPASASVHFEALRYFSKRGCSLKSLHLVFNVGCFPSHLAVIGLEEFGEIVHDLGPQLDRISITLRHYLERLPLKYSGIVLPYWSPAIGWYVCNMEKHEGIFTFGGLERHNKIPTWTFRPLRDHTPSSSNRSYDDETLYI